MASRLCVGSTAGSTARLVSSSRPRDTLLSQADRYQIWRREQSGIAASDDVHEYVVEQSSNGGGGAEIQVTRKPEGMPEQEAYARVNAALEEHLDGPWAFTVSVPADDGS